MFAGHRIEGELGRGGMGIVYRARHVALDQPRALKVIAPELAASEKFRRRFVRESRIAASIDHPNVVPVYHAGEDAGQLYLSMREIEGSDLGELVRQSGPLEPDRVVRIVRGIAAGLEAAHEKGLVHRDVKPSNVLIETPSEGERVYVADFGISRLDQDSRPETATSEFIGTPDYVAPEQVELGSADRRSDVYSLGGLAHFLLTGEEPFPNRSEAGKLVAHAKAPRPRPSERRAFLPAGVDAVVAQAMAIDPSDRYRDVGEFASALGTALQSGGGRRSGSGRLRRRLLAVGVLAGAAALLAVVLIGENDQAPREDVPVNSADLPPAGEVVASIAMGSEPTAMTVGEIKVWVVSREAGSLVGISPETNRPDPPVDVGVGAEPVAVAVGFGSIWVVDQANDSLVRLDPGSGGSPIAIPVGSSPAAVVVGQQWLWVANSGDSTVSRVDPFANVADATIPVDDNPRSLAYARERIWVASPEGRSLSQIDLARANAVRGPARLEVRPDGQAVAQGVAWIADRNRGTIQRLDPRTMEPTTDPIELQSEIAGLALSGESLFVASASGLERLSATTGSAQHSQVALNGKPSAIATGKGAVWIATGSDNRIHRLLPTRGQG